MSNLTKKKHRVSVFQVLNVIFLAVVCTICLIPFVHMIALSFSTPGAIAAGRVTLWPVEFTTGAYEYTIFGGRFPRAFLNSVVRTVLGTLVNLVMLVLTAYPLAHSKDRLRGRNLYTVFFVFVMIFNGGMIPTYLVVSRLGLKDTVWALVLPGALPVYNMMILMNFIRGLPGELEEAAIIDGATPFQTLTRVILPLLKPSLATVGLFCIVNHWNEWFNGVIYMNDVNKFPLQSYLQSMLKNIEEALRHNSDREMMEALAGKLSARNGRAAQLLLAAFPMMLAYPFLQKYFTKGLTLGSVKG